MEMGDDIGGKNQKKTTARSAVSENPRREQRRSENPTGPTGGPGGAKGLSGCRTSRRTLSVTHRSSTRRQLRGGGRRD